jgi:hypothetical protein
MTTFNVGDKVKIVQHRIERGPDHQSGTGIIAKVGYYAITLEDGSKWRRDGYYWGSKPTKGLGRFYEKRIERDEG